MNKLTLDDFCNAAKQLSCSVSAIKAVATVESGGRSGFDEKGRLLLRFEGHIFRKFTGGRFDQSHPHLSYSYGNRHGKTHGYTAFNEAFALDKIAAMLATSFGMFQPMGFNHDEMGYDSVEHMVADFQTGEKAQLLAFVRLIKKWGLDDELGRATLRDFQVFAKRYNGADYKSNRYDTKMHDYYLESERRGVRCPQEVTPNNVSSIIDSLKTEKKQEDAISPSIPAVQSDEQIREEQIPNSIAPDVSSQPPSETITKSETSIIDCLNTYGEKAQTISTKVQTVSDTVSNVSKSSIGTFIWKQILAFVMLITGLVENNWEWVLVGLVILFVAAWLWNESKKRAAERTVAMLKK